MFPDSDLMKDACRIVQSLTLAHDTISQKEKISHVCLFSPDYMMKMVKSVFPVNLRDKVKISVDGNFSQHSPMELLEKLNLKIKKLI